jgi:predicted TIM-barrel fold metal-dependent hydrolase
MSDLIIDFHVHAFNDELAPTVIPRLEHMSGCRAFYNGTVSGLLESMRRSGIAQAVLQPVATKPAQVPIINRWCLEVVEAHAGGEPAGEQPAVPQLHAFGALHPDMPEEAIEREVEFLKAHNFRGVKLHPEYQSFYPDEDRLEPLYRALERQGLCLLMHAGFDLGYPTQPKATPNRILQVLLGFPGLRLIAAHLGGFRLWDDVEHYLVGRQVGLDTAYCADDCPQPLFREIVRAHGPEHIYFASDGPWGDQTRHLAYLRTAGLTPDEFSRIAGGNATDILK